ncbi:MAG: hypothetical protein JWN23_535 [Rhodocyclales bacterium]|nr:hypothetical protein [Rhodocyclales bacterium]
MRESLAATFRLLPDDQLIERFNPQRLTAVGYEVMREELLSRGLTLPSPPVSEAPPIDEGDFHDFEIIARQITPTTAYILAAKLQEEGVLAHVADANAAQMIGTFCLSLIGARVLVPGDRVAQAQTVISGIEEGLYLLKDEEDKVANTLSLDAQRLLAFSQDPYYLKRWSGDHAALPFNLAAFIFGPIWLFYRKLYAIGMAWLLGEYLFVLGVGFLLDISEGGRQVWHFVAAFLIARLMLTFAANFLYKSKARKVIAALVRQTEDEPRILKALHRYGGVSVPAALAASALSQAIVGFA